jgi:hypothetical protein
MSRALPAEREGRQTVSIVLRGKGVKFAQKTQVGPCIPVGIQRWKAEVGPTSGPNFFSQKVPREFRRRFSHLGGEAGRLLLVVGFGRVIVSETEVPIISVNMYEADEQ